MLNIADDNTVLSFREKMTMTALSYQRRFYGNESEIFDYLEGDSTVFEQGPMQKLRSRRPMKSFYHGGFWQCMDTQREMKKIRRTVAVRKSTVEDPERLRSCYDIKRTEIIL